MDLYLIRHAAAVSAEEAHVDDADRPLTSAGEEQARSVARALQRQGVQLSLVLTSPLLRAQQTAQGILQHWPAPAPALQVSDALAPDGRRKKLAKLLRSLEEPAVGLVGHMPHLGELSGWLLGSRKVYLDMAKAGVALIRCDGSPGKGTGSLVWMVTPLWLVT